MGGGPLSASAIRLQPQFDVPLVVAVNAAARAALEAAHRPGRHAGQRRDTARRRAYIGSIGARSLACQLRTGKSMRV